MIVLVTLCCFYLYFIISSSIFRTKIRLVLVAIFLIFSFSLRLLVEPSLNSDYDAYVSHGYILFEWDTKLLFFEPYEAIIISITNIYTKNSDESYSILYWINCIVITILFVRVAFFKNVETWKKVLFFSFFYFPLAYVLLRNGIPYMLVAIYCYKRGRLINFRTMYISFLFHMSSLPVIMLSLLKKNNNLVKFTTIKILFFSTFVIVLLIIGSSYLGNDTLNNFEQLQIVISKQKSYSESNENIGISLFHRVYFLFMVVLIVHFYLENKNRGIEYFFVGLSIFYLFTNQVNGVMGYRFSTYLLSYLLFYPISPPEITTINKYINIASLFLSIVFIYSLYGTHFL